jgi:hypothetical protein
MGVATTFVTGKNAVIRVNGVFLTQAIDLSYNISIKHFGARTLGQFENDSIEPLAYDVTGSFSIIRYIEGVTSKRRVGIGTTTPNGTDNNGNGLGTWGDDSRGGFNNDRASQALDPSQMNTAQTFDIELYQNLGGDLSGITRIRGCRIINAASQVNVRGFLIQSFTFMASYVDEDSFLARPSFNSDGVK